MIRAIFELVFLFSTVVLVSIFLYLKPAKVLKSQTAIQKYGSFYPQINVGKQWTRAYASLFLLRRFCQALILAVLPSHTFATQISLVISWLSLGYLHIIKPYHTYEIDSNQTQAIETCNEIVFILFLSWQLCFFKYFDSNLELKFYQGWIVSGIIAFLIIANLILLIYQKVLLKLYYKLITFQLKKERQKRLVQKKESALIEIKARTDLNRISAMAVSKPKPISHEE